VIANINNNLIYCKIIVEILVLTKRQIQAIHANKRKLDKTRNSKSFQKLTQSRKEIRHSCNHCRKRDHANCTHGKEGMDCWCPSVGHYNPAGKKYW
jgi:hypothetical protein